MTRQDIITVSDIMEMYGMNRMYAALVMNLCPFKIRIGKYTFCSREDFNKWTKDGTPILKKAGEQ